MGWVKINYFLLAVIGGKKKKKEKIQKASVIVCPYPIPTDNTAKVGKQLKVEQRREGDSLLVLTSLLNYLAIHFDLIY